MLEKLKSQLALVLLFESVLEKLKSQLALELALELAQLLSKSPHPDRYEIDAYLNQLH